MYTKSSGNKDSLFLQESEHRLAYLLEHYSFPLTDIALNSTVLNWPTKINPIFDECDEVKIELVLYGNIVIFELRFTSVYLKNMHGLSF